MKTQDFDFHLPRELIAQTPIEPRDHSKMLVLSRADGSITQSHFYNLPDFLSRGDLLVFNDSRVFPARLHGRKIGTGGRVELLLLNRLSPELWRTLVRPGRGMGKGAAFEIFTPGVDNINGVVVSVGLDGTRKVRLSPEESLREAGVIPLPPYIHRPLADYERYQTVYGQTEGSVAAPTAGLHFTSNLLDRIRSVGVKTVFVTLHVGWDSFRPVKGEDPTSHKMHSEYWDLNPEATDEINRTKSEGGRVISVGTTVVRVVEHAAILRRAENEKTVDCNQILSAGSGWVDLFILPGHSFRVADSLVTNFHLPRSTLLMLTSAFAGRDLLLRAYSEAIEHNYRFYSFGDAMLIL